MTNDDLTKYLSYFAKAQNMPVEGMDAHLDRCVQLGLAEFWGWWWWSFRLKDYTLTTSTEAERYELDDDFDGVNSVREKASLHGGSLRYVTKTEFDRILAHSTSHPSERPVLYTIYKDDEKWYIKLYPVPNVTPMYISFYRKSPGNIDTIPDKFLGALTACVMKYFAPPGSMERWSAQQEQLSLLQKLQTIDKPIGSLPDRILDESDTAIRSSQYWIEGPVA